MFDTKGYDRKLALEKTIDSIRNRFGRASIERAAMLEDRLLSSLNVQTEYSVQGMLN